MTVSRAYFVLVLLVVLSPVAGDIDSNTPNVPKEAELTLKTEAPEAAPKTDTPAVELPPKVDEVENEAPIDEIDELDVDDAGDDLDSPGEPAREAEKDADDFFNHPVQSASPEKAPASPTAVHAQHPQQPSMEMNDMRDLRVQSLLPKSSPSNAPSPAQRSPSLMLQKYAGGGSKGQFLASQRGVFPEPAKPAMAQERPAFVRPMPSVEGQRYQRAPPMSPQYNDEYLQDEDYDYAPDATCGACDMHIKAAIFVLCFSSGLVLVSIMFKDPVKDLSEWMGGKPEENSSEERLVEMTSERRSATVAGRVEG